METAFLIVLYILIFGPCWAWFIFYLIIKCKRHCCCTKRLNNSTSSSTGASGPRNDDRSGTIPMSECDKKWNSNGPSFYIERWEYYQLGGWLCCVGALSVAGGTVKQLCRSSILNVQQLDVNCGIKVLMYFWKNDETSGRVKFYQNTVYLIKQSWIKTLIGFLML